MGKKYTREELKKFIELIFTYGNTFTDSNDNRLSNEIKDKYSDLTLYLSAPRDEHGNHSPETTLEFLDVMAEYFVDQYIDLGKEIELTKALVPVSPASPEDIEKEKNFRYKYATAIAIANSLPGSRVHGPAQFIPLIDDALSESDYIKIAELTGLNPEDVKTPAPVFQKLVDTKADARLKTLSDEDKEYFIAGRQNIKVPGPDSAEYVNVSPAWKDIADYKKRKTDKAIDEFIAKGNGNEYLDNFDGLKDKITHYNDSIKPKLKSNYDELFNIPTNGHTNSGKYNEIVEAYNTFNTSLKKAKLEGEGNIFESNPKAILKRKNISGACDRLEDSLVNYLEGKWKSRWTPLGTKRYDQVFKILESVNPEKAQAMKDFHEKKRNGEINKKMSFEDFRSNNPKKSVNINDLIAEEEKSGNKKKTIGKVKASKEKVSSLDNDELKF